MAVFKTYDELYTYMGRLYDEAKSDARIAPKIKASNLVIQFRYDDPHAVVTINAAKPPTQPGAIFDVLWGDDTGLKPDIEMSMKSDVAHQFWHGKVNLMAALARRHIIAKGPIPKILKLLPSVEPMYEMYPRLLREMGRDDLVIS
ncbi:hypothetical protein SE17_25195 [Kouleothrix aurantiaca]|jgi:hypothetical protein|uniref:SCP2 domain-containing protein n=1 Tax=Kouleothrix aurantiaca TaxID=186479 RepID=A0A0P9FD32_9CHLR|nr:hypothetical protein SE17_25195 [Kouleothrix aurantiaca]